MSSKNKWMSLNQTSKIPLKTQSTERSKTKTIKSVSETKTYNNFDYFKSLKPKTIEDLVVHTKKIEEVHSWLDQFVVKSRKSNGTPKLLITGPTGSGKTSTVKLLCKKLSIVYEEWINPVDSRFEGDFVVESQSMKFVEFINECNFPSLLCSSDFKKVVIVKDFPHVFMRNPSEFHECLGDINNLNNLVVIFICTDSASKDINLEQLLFTDQIRIKYNIDQITFNSCANTLLKALLKRAQNVVAQHPDLFKVPSATLCEAIATSSMGDIQCAINQYYMASLKGSKDLPISRKEIEAKPGTKRKRTSKSILTLKNTKNESLGLFHALGRILNPKFDVNTMKIKCDLEGLVDELCISPRMTNSFLFENYLNYFGDLQDASNALEAMIDAQKLLDSWSDRYETLSIALWIAVFGMMHANRNRVSKWNQIRGPKRVEKCLKSVSNSDLVDPTDYCYYNLITKSTKYFDFNSFSSV